MDLPGMKPSFFEASRKDGVEAHHMGMSIEDELDPGQGGLYHKLRTMKGTVQSTRAMLDKGLERLHSAIDRAKKSATSDDDKQREQGLDGELEKLLDFTEEYLTINDEDTNRRSIMAQIIIGLLSIQDLIPNVMKAIKEYQGLRTTEQA